MKNELLAMRDNLKCALNMGGLREAAEWTVSELERLASLPVGVPDGWRLVPVEPTPEIIRAMMDNVRDVSGVLAGFTNAYRAMLAAAPTVKAEQVDDLDTDRVAVCGCRIANTPKLGGNTVILCATHEPPSLPAAGSAVEEVEVVAHFQIPTGGSYAGERFTRIGPVPECPAANRTYDPLMTVAQHERIVAALSAQQSAQHVSARQARSIKLLDMALENHGAWLKHDPFLIELRALLNGGEA